MLYYASRISDNISRREPEGYLFCVNVPIARSGTQRYLQDEIGEQGNNSVTVYRPEEEVFSEATIASFEGMPVTNDHPDTEEGVTVDNVQYLGKGHCQNVRRGTDLEKDLLIADLVITDPLTIQDVLDGKREISCGYNYVMDIEDGRYIQRQIRGNHIAIVDKGRAGHRVCIKDSAPNYERRKTKMAKKNHSGILAKMLAAFVAHDAEPEEIEEAVDAIEDITGEAEEPEKVEAVEEVKEADEAPADDVIAKIMERLDALEAAIAAKDEAPEEEEKDPLKELEDELMEQTPTEEVTPDEDPDEQESHFVDPEEINEQDEDEVIEEEEEKKEEVADKKACDAMREVIKTIRPIIAKLPDKERKQASDAMAKQLRAASGISPKAERNDYLKLKNRKKASDSKVDPQDLGKAIMANRNPNYKK